MVKLNRKHRLLPRAAVFIVLLSLLLGFQALTARSNHAHAAPRYAATYFTKNDGTNFSRSTSPFTSGVATQAANSDGSVTVSINSTSGYADSGFVIYKGTLGNLPNYIIKGTGDQFSTNLWFDKNNNNEFFAWDSNNVLTGLDGDTYALSSGSSGGTLAVNGSTSFYLMSDSQNHTLSSLKSGSVSGISSSTKVAIWVGVNTSSGSTSATIKVINSAQSPAVYRPSNGTWYVRQPDGSTTSFVHGNSTDIPVAGDFDGDGITDYAIFRPGDQDWIIYESSNLSTPVYVNSFGTTGDIPVVGDYDGDGKTDVAFWRPSNGTWYVKYSSDGTTHTLAHGNGSYDTPVTGDFDGDGKADYGIFRPSDNDWIFYLSSDMSTTTTVSSFGQTGDIPVVGDYDGDGKTDVAFWRPSNGTWYVKYSSDGTTHTLVHGNGSYDTPVPGDYDGDGKADYAVFRPSDTSWIIYESSDMSNYVTVSFGTTGDKPLAFYP